MELARKGEVEPTMFALNSPSVRQISNVIVWFGLAGRSNVKRARLLCVLNEIGFLTDHNAEAARLFMNHETHVSDLAVDYSSLEHDRTLMRKEWCIIVSNCFEIV